MLAGFAQGNVALEPGTLAGPEYRATSLPLGASTEIWLDPASATYSLPLLPNAMPSGACGPYCVGA